MSIISVNWHKMEADFRELLAPPPKEPEISNINNVLSIQPLPQASLAADE